MEQSEKRPVSRSHDLTRQDVARYTREMLVSLSEITRTKKMGVLAQLIDRAAQEASMQIAMDDDESRALDSRDRFLSSQPRYDGGA